MECREQSMRIGLNAGHTLAGPGSGAMGVIIESTETRKVCKRLTEMFRASGIEVVPCTVDKAATQNAYLQKAVEMANREDLDWFISIHFNNDAKKAGHGVEVYTYKGRQYPDAVEVCEHIAALGFTNRGVKAGNGFYVIRKTKAKSMLIEVCFVNDPDASVYQQKFEQVCAAIAYALADYVQAKPKPAAPAQLPQKKKYVKVLVDNLAVRKSLSWNNTAVAGRVQKNEVFTVIRGPVKVGGGSMYELKSGLFITAAEEYVKVYSK